MRTAHVLLLAMAVTSAAKATEVVPVQTSLQQLLQSPKSFADSHVRVTGQVDNCFGFTCNLCPSEMTNATFDVKKCLGVSFYGFSGANGLMDHAFRFAVVTLDARFNPSCLDEKVMCLDRVSELMDARVIEVHSRHSALDGIVSWHDEGILILAPAIDQQGMKIELNALGSPPDPTRKDEMYFLFSMIELAAEKRASHVFALKKAAKAIGRRDFFGDSTVSAILSPVH